MWKLTQAMSFGNNLTVTFLFGAPVEMTAVFPPAKHALHDSVSYESFCIEISNKRSDRGALQ